MLLTNSLLLGAWSFWYRPAFVSIRSRSITINFGINITFSTHHHFHCVYVHWKNFGAPVAPIGTAAAPNVVVNVIPQFGAADAPFPHSRCTRSAQALSELHSAIVVFDFGNHDTPLMRERVVLIVLIIMI